MLKLQGRVEELETALANASLTEVSGPGRPKKLAAAPKLARCVPSVVDLEIHSALANTGSLDGLGVWA